MKNSQFILLFLFSILWSSEATGLKSNASFNNDIFSHFKSGSSKEIARYFEQTILLNINGINGDYSKTQAEYILKDFFLEYPPLGFSILHQSDSSGPKVFYVGAYETKGEQFRVLIKGYSKTELLKIYSIDIIKAKI